MDASQQINLVSGDLLKVCISHISCGFNHSLAVTPNGLLFAWGFNFFGELGLGNNENQELP